MSWLLMMWVACGFLAYGLNKGRWRNYYQNRRFVGHSFVTSEILCLVNMLLGWYGLLATLLVNVFFTFVKIHPEDNPWGFCLKMPKELCSGYGERS